MKYRIPSKWSETCCILSPGMSDLVTQAGSDSKDASTKDKIKRPSTFLLFLFISTPNKQPTLRRQPPGASGSDSLLYSWRFLQCWHLYGIKHDENIQRIPEEDSRLAEELEVLRIFLGSADFGQLRSRCDDSLTAGKGVEARLTSSSSAPGYEIEIVEIDPKTPIPVFPSP